MLLVECQERDVDALKTRFGAEHVASIFAHDVDRTRPKPHGPAVVVRHGITISDHRPTFAWHGGIEPKADKSLTVEISGPFGDCTVMATHVMNGGDGPDGWDRKLRTYERLEEVLQADSTAWPVIVGMDGNVWEDHLDQRPDPDQSAHPQAWFHSGWASHDLIDTLRHAVLADANRAEAARNRLSSYDGIVGTYEGAATVTRMDRLYVSPDLTILDAGVDADALEISDHALIWADLLLPCTVSTTDPDVMPAGSRTAVKRELSLDELVHEILRADRYGWNRRGYLARVALASLSAEGSADRNFIADHYPGDVAPHRQWSGARSTTNRSWSSLGKGRFGDELVLYDSTARRHRMDPGAAHVLVSQLGIEDLVADVRRPDLEVVLRERLQPNADAPSAE